MVSIPLPETVVSWWDRLVGGSTLDLVWKAGILVILVALSLLLAALGFLGATIAGIILATLIAPEVRAVVLDIWHRDFEEV